MKFKTKLYIGLGSILASIIILVVILLNMLNQQTVKMNIVVNELSGRIKLTSTIQYEISNMGRVISEISSSLPEELRLQKSNEW